jgi:hypothetical protein
VAVVDLIAQFGFGLRDFSGNVPRIGTLQAAHEGLGFSLWQGGRCVTGSHFASGASSDRTFSLSADCRNVAVILGI